VTGVSNGDGVECSSSYELAYSSDLELETTGRTSRRYSQRFPLRSWRYMKNVVLLLCCLFFTCCIWRAIRVVRATLKKGLVTSGAFVEEPEFGALPLFNESDCQTFSVRSLELNSLMGSYGDSRSRTQVGVQCNAGCEYVDISCAQDIYAVFEHLEISIGSSDGSDMGSYHFFSRHKTWRNSEQVAKLRSAPDGSTDVGVQCDSYISGCTVSFDLTVCCSGLIQNNTVPQAWVLMEDRPTARRFPF